MTLSRLLAGERTVGEMEDATGIGKRALSQQLAELRRAELVETRRAAKQVFYRLPNDNTALSVRTIEPIFGTGRAVATARSTSIAAPPLPTAIRVARPAASAPIE